MRVAQACSAHLSQSGETETKIIDPLDIDAPRGFKPLFSYRAGQAPQDLQALADLIQKADGFVMVSPEYNHSMSASD
jgi:NAD(P)H-dependent FMN reductase